MIIFHVFKCENSRFMMLTLREHCINSLLGESPSWLDNINVEAGMTLIPDEELQKMKANTFALVIGAPKLFDDYDISKHSLASGHTAYTSTLAEYAEEVILGLRRDRSTFYRWGILVDHIDEWTRCRPGIEPREPIDFNDETQKKLFEFYGYPCDSDHCFSHYCHRVWRGSKKLFYPD